MIRALRQMRSRVRGLLLLRRIGLIVGVALVGLLVWGLLDYVLRFPAPVRLVVLGAGIVGLVVAWVRWVVPAWRFRPTLVDIALRVERAQPSWRGALAAAIDFEESNDRDRDGLTGALRDMVVAAAAGRWNDAALRGLVKPGPALQGAGAGVVGVALVAALALSVPMLAGIGAARVLTPWSDASWPKRTGVVDVTERSVHPIGERLPLRAALTRSARSPQATDVSVRYRLLTEGARTTERRELLTYQNTRIAAGEEREGALFERLLEPAAEVIEYRFETEDDATEWQRIRLVPAPAIVGALAEVSLPEYARVGEDAAQRTIDLGPGTDERARTPSLLVGSTVDLLIRLNKPARLRDAEDARSWLEALVGEGVLVESASTEPEALRARFVLEDSFRLPIALVDEYGIASADDVSYRFEAMADRPPGVTITEPTGNRTVLASAVVPVRVEARDDVALSWVSLRRQVHVRAGAPGSEPSPPGGATEPREDPVEVVRLGDDGSLGAVATLEHVLDLSELDVRAGDVVHLQGFGADRRIAADDAVDAVGSPVRMLMVISAEQFVEEVRGALSELRQATIRTEAQQGEVRAATQQRGADTPNQRGQGQVSERIARQLDQVGALRDRIESNRLDDRALDELLSEAARSLREAGQSAADAGEQMDRAAGDGDASMSEQEADAVDRAQQRTQEELRRLIELLDRGEDAWVVRSRIERMIEAQRGLQGEAAELAQQTAGRRMEDLTPEQRELVDQLAREQAELSQRMQELVQEIREREQMLREQDPTAAMGLQQAAQRAEQQQTAQTMQRASEQAQQNQMSNTQDSQQEAIESLEQMLEDLDAGERNRQEVLRRMLLSIIESLERLVSQQEMEIAALDDAVRRGVPLRGLERGMIALNTNTLGVLDQARAGGAELGQVANLVDRAAGAQENAIAGLRAPDPEADRVREHEERSLVRLREALEIARRQEQRIRDEEMERQRRELRAAYREALERQTAIIAQTRPFTELEQLNRRDRVALRAIVEPQGALRMRLQGLLEGDERLPGLSESPVFVFAHRSMESASQRAEGALDEAEPDRAVAAQRSIARTLADLLEALRDPEPDNEFEDGAGGGGGGGGGAGGEGEEAFIAPLAELRMLRALQTSVMEETALLDRRGANAAALQEIGARQSELADLADELIRRMMQ